MQRTGPLLVWRSQAPLPFFNSQHIVLTERNEISVGFDSFTMPTSTTTPGRVFLHGCNLFKVYDCIDNCAELTWTLGTVAS
jgi:hypothetical protein